MRTSSISNSTAVSERKEEVDQVLKPSERERLQDCLLLLQSARNILSGMKPNMIPELPDIQKCFHDVDRTLCRLLRT